MVDWSIIATKASHKRCLSSLPTSEAAATVSPTSICGINAGSLKTISCILELPSEYGNGKASGGHPTLSKYAQMFEKRNGAILCASTQNSLFSTTLGCISATSKSSRADFTLQCKSSIVGNLCKASLHQELCQQRPSSSSPQEVGHSP